MNFADYLHMKKYEKHVALKRVLHSKPVEPKPAPEK